LASGACLIVAAYAVAGLWALGMAERLQDGARIPTRIVTGGAAAALGRNGTFAMTGAPPGVLPTVPLVDAESAAVALAYRSAPTHKVMRLGELVERPSERRHVCGRSYYVRSVVTVPDSVAKQPFTADMVMFWGPTWVVPVCDDAGTARTTAIVADAPTRARVVLGDQPGDVPELVYPRDGYGHIVSMPGRFRGWEQGIALTPETAVAIAARELAGTGARVAQIPEAFKLVLPPSATPRDSTMDQSMSQPGACPRWRLTLDRDVTLRGTVSRQVVRTRTVYVARGDNGCEGAPTLQIPRSTQPTTLPFWYGMRPPVPHPVVPRQGPLPADLSPLETRRAALRVIQPIWFERARLSGMRAEGRVG
jgi:hypothetical protein